MSGIQQGSLKTITDSKLAAFDVGSQRKSRFQKAREEEEKKKRREVEEAERLYADFVASFDIGVSSSKCLLKEIGSMDVPIPVVHGQQSQRISDDIASCSGSKNRGNKQIDQLLSELSNMSNFPKKIAMENASGSHDNGDGSTTNLYVGHIAPTVTEEQLEDLFSKFGEINSVKIMWPRTEEERLRKRNCGFVSYKERKCAESAREQLDRYELHGMELNVGWGKAIKIVHTHSVYTPSNSVGEGNKSSDFGKKVFENCSFSSSGAHARFDTNVKGNCNAANNVDEKSHIRVLLPSNTRKRKLIDLLASFVAVDGEIFENVLIANESYNEDFNFLSSTQSELAYYYRWRTYFNIMGDEGTSNRRLGSFCMVKFGQHWTPPSCDSMSASTRSTFPRGNHGKRNRSSSIDECRDFIPYRGKRARDCSSRKDDGLHCRVHLIDEDKKKFVHTMRRLTLARTHVKSATTFAIDHADCAHEVIEMIEEIAFSKSSTRSCIAMISELFLLSDILYNSAASVKFAASYRGLIQGILPMFFEHLNRLFISIDGRMTAKNMEEKVKAVLLGWKDWSIFPTNFLDGLEATFFRSFGDVEHLHFCPKDKIDWDERMIKEERLDSVRRRATASGVTFYEDSEITFTESNAKAHREMLQLERKLQYVSSFSAVKEGIDYDVDGEVYDVFGDIDIYGEAMRDDTNDKIGLYESVDGVALDV